MPEPSGIPIPEFNHEGLLPPILHPTQPTRSPYAVSIDDLIWRFGTSAQRCGLLRRFVRLRHALLQNGFCGFQWVGGSFVEKRMVKTLDNKERRGASAEPEYVEWEPGDIDVVSFVNHNIKRDNLLRIVTEYKLLSHTGSKEKYGCDSYMVDISSSQDNIAIVNQSTYWYSMFSHTRNMIWKGMLKLPLPESPMEQYFCMALINWRQYYEPAHQAINRI